MVTSIISFITSKRRVEQLDLVSNMKWSLLHLSSASEKQCTKDVHGRGGQMIKIKRSSNQMVTKSSICPQIINYLSSPHLDIRGQADPCQDWRRGWVRKNRTAWPRSSHTIWFGSFFSDFAPSPFVSWFLEYCDFWNIIIVTWINDNI